MTKFLSIKSRLILIIAFLTGGMLAMGLFGLEGIRKSNADLQDVYEHRTVPLGQLGQIEVLLQQDRLTASVFQDAPTPEMMSNQIAIIENNIAEVAMLLEAYTSGKLVPEEMALAKEFVKDNSRFVGEGLRPILAAWRSNELNAANEIITRKMSHLYRPVVIGIERLRQLQIDTAKTQYEQATIRYARVRNIFLLAMTLGLGLAILSGIALVRAIVRPLGNAVNVANAVSEGDLTSRITADALAGDETGRLLLALKNMNDNLVRLVGKVRASADSIRRTSIKIDSGNSELTQHTEEQAASLEETTSSMEELSATVKSNADNARNASQLGIGAREVAIKGGEVVGRVVNTMASISESSSKIVDIISVIEGIAFQTNILALNAAVEAARAGEQGRGFAVVAGEVRALAQRSATAAKEIKALIDDSVAKVAGGNKQVDEAGKTMEEIVAAVKQVTDILAEISAASSEQSAGIEHVSKAILQMEAVTQQNASLATETAAAAESMKNEAEILAGAVSVFKLSEELTGELHAQAASPLLEQDSKRESGASDPKQGSRRKAIRENNDVWKEF